MIGRLLRLGVMTVALFGAGHTLAKPARQAPAPALVQDYQPKPAIWKLADADTTIFLFGTTHALPATFKWRTPAFDAIAAKADELVIESVDAPSDDAKIDTALDDILAEDSGRLPLAKRIAPAKRSALKRAMAKAALPSQVYDLMPTWLAAFTLVVGDMERAGQSSDYGVETVLQKEFETSKRPVGAVEDGDAILRQMHDLPEKAQVAMLEDAIADLGGPDAAPGGVTAGDHAWAKGDDASFEAEFTEAGLGRELYDILIRRRNAAWTSWLTMRLEKPGTVLFAVGAGHFAGPDSLGKLLAAKKLTLERVQ